jgi:hypothetical protein
VPAGSVSILDLVLMLVTYDDGTEEAFDVAATTKLRRLLNEGYWTFSPTTGGEVCLSVDKVDEVRLGNAVVHAEQRQE